MILFPMSRGGGVKEFEDTLIILDYFAALPVFVVLRVGRSFLNKWISLNEGSFHMVQVSVDI